MNQGVKNESFFKNESLVLYGESSVGSDCGSEGRGFPHLSP